MLNYGGNRGLEDYSTTREVFVLKDIPNECGDLGDWFSVN